MRNKVHVFINQIFNPILFTGPFIELGLLPLTSHNQCPTREKYTTLL